MKITDNVRHIDDLGRIVIPKKIRKELGVREGDSLQMSITDGKLTLTKYEPSNALILTWANKILEDDKFNIKRISKDCCSVFVITKQNAIGYCDYISLEENELNIIAVAIAYCNATKIDIPKFVLKGREK